MEAPSPALALRSPLAVVGASGTPAGAARPGEALCDDGGATSPAAASPDAPPTPTPVPTNADVAAPWWAELDFFRTPLMDPRGDSAAASCAKTVIFAVILVLAAVALVAYTATRERTYIRTFAATPAAVLGHSSDGRPACRCARALTLGDLDMLRPRSAADFTRNECGAVRALMQVLTGAAALLAAPSTPGASVVNFTALTGMSGAQAAVAANNAVAMTQYLYYSIGACGGYESTSIPIRFTSVQTGPLLLLRDEFSALARTSLMTALSVTHNYLVDNLFQVLALVDLQGTHIAAATLLAGATNRTPANCSCAPPTEWGARAGLSDGLPVYADYPACTFTMPWSARVRPLTCHIIRDAISLPTDVLWDGAGLRALGLAPVLDNALAVSLVEAIVGAPLVVPRPNDKPRRETLSGAMWSLIQDGYLRDGYADALPANTTLWAALAADSAGAALAPGVLALDWEAYFRKCEPSTCTYAVTRRADAGTVVVLLLGVLGGLSAVLRVAIIAVYGALQRAKQRREGGSGGGAAPPPATTVGRAIAPIGMF